MAAETAAPGEVAPDAPAPAGPAAAPADAKEGKGAKGAAGKAGKESGKAGEKAAKKPKKGKKGEPEAPAGASDGPSIAAHPRAARAVARAKGWGGLAGFALAGYLSLSTSTMAEAALRALVAGVVCYVAVWAGAVFLWRRLVVLELKGRQQQAQAAAEAAAARRELPPGPPERPRAKARAAS
ncbi:MAG TPA: hypothetical protein VL979_04885 [Solirubrobacteraceae bacterium]|nr:hypothetical protein [Solirubrobacteraceae bacterium]